MATWMESAEKLGLAPEQVPPPPDKSGDWYQVLAVFARTAFFRVLAESQGRAFIQLAAPDLTTPLAESLRDLLAKKSQKDWDVAEDAPGFHFHGTLGESTELLIDLLKISDGIRALDESATIADVLESLSASTEDATSKDPNEESSDDSPSGSDSPFETIGSVQASSGTGSATGTRTFCLQDGDDIAVGIGMAENLSETETSSLRRKLVRALRTKFDVELLDDPIAVRSPIADFSTRVEVRLSATGLDGSRVRVSDVEPKVREYLQTIEDLAGAGVDPLVFLGVRESSRLSSPPPGELVVPASSKEAPEHEESTGFVFGFVAGPEDEVVVEATGPLEPGNFDDPRLREPDASTALVDVVLRHPGYAIRRVAQVLSILMSIDHYEAMRAVEEAPIVIFWAVSQERAQTMRTVLEGAGARIQFVEPGRYGTR